MLALPRLQVSGFGITEKPKRPALTRPGPPLTPLRRPFGRVESRNRPRLPLSRASRKRDSALAPRSPRRNAMVLDSKRAGHCTRCTQPFVDRTTAYMVAEHFRVTSAGIRGAVKGGRSRSSAPAASRLARRRRRRSPASARGADSSCCPRSRRRPARTGARSARGEPDSGRAGDCSAPVAGTWPRAGTETPSSVRGAVGRQPIGGGGYPRQAGHR
jgi:hypothetical protein